MRIALDKIDCYCNQRLLDNEKLNNLVYLLNIKSYDNSKRQMKLILGSLY